jgi:NitT/TauT family transport system ATP-binding protein
MAEIVLRGVSKSFPGADGLPFPVLAGVSLHLESPAIVSIVGFNGTGKTTLLRIMAGLLRADSGELKLDSQSPETGRIGYVPRRIDDDIALPMEIQGIPCVERRRQAAELVKRFSFPLPLHARSNTLSGGQKQLVNLCRALIGNPPPKILLLDEPFSALDPIVRQEFVAHLQAVRKEFNLVILLTTHYLDLAILASDYIVPFRQRPASVTQADMIPIPFGFPRNSHLRSSAEYQALLERVENIFEKAPAELR